MKSITQRYWQQPDAISSNVKERSLAKHFKVAPEIIQLLVRRGVTSREEIKKFLYPELGDLHKPSLIKDMQKACELIYEHLISQKQILIWGDYDVDGVTGTSLLITFFRSLGYSPEWFIPNRFSHGYGLNLQKLKDILSASDDVPLIITVDCGISNGDEIEYLRKMGSRVVVTDHHEPGDTLPPADALLNCKINGCNFPDKNMSGVAMAFYLAAGLRGHFQEMGYFKTGVESPNLKQLLEFVAIGTIADMVPLTNQNRILTRGGFEVLNAHPSLGLACLLEECNIFTPDITAEDIAFQLAPKINAAGRLYDASLAVELLTETDPQRAKKISKKLTAINNERKELCHTILESTLTFLERGNDEIGKIIVLRIDCPLGVIGIVASQLSNRFNVPVILVTRVKNNDGAMVLKGSCRSVYSVNIYTLLSATGSYLLEYGGHPMAAGLTLEESQFDGFKEKASELIESSEKQAAEYEEADLFLPIERAVNMEITQGLQLLEPFGQGNKKPIFYDEKIVVQEVKKIGKSGDHLSFIKRGKFENKKCIAFQFGSFDDALQDKPSYDALYTVSISRYKKAVQWQAHIVDMI